MGSWGGKFIKKVVNIMLNVFIVILGIILLITIYNNIQIKVLGNDYSSFFGHSVFEVQTGSMSDAINAGDWIIVKRSDNIKLDDIVTFKHKGEFITHRVIEAYNGTYVTKGDANSAKDKPISKEQIVGKVIKVLPGFGILKKTIFNPIVLFALVIILYLVNGIFKKTTSDEVEKEKRLVEKVKATVKRKKKKEDVDALFDEVDTKVEEELESNEVDVLNDEVVDSNVVLEDTTNMDKTVFFRMVSVDQEEIDKVYRKGEINLDEGEVVSKLIKKDEEEIEDVSDEKIKSLLEIIQKKRKKSKNFIEKAIMIKKEELEEIVDILNYDNEIKTNEPTIINSFINRYVDYKYYNKCDEVVMKVGKTKVESVLKDFADGLIASYNGPDEKYSEKVEKFRKYFILISHLEQDYKSINNIKDKRNTYGKKLLKYINYSSLSNKDIKDMINGIIKVQKTYESTMKFILNKLDTNMFELKFNKLSKKEHFGVELQHNLSFSKVYSDYIVDKTYFEGVVAEDKIEVLVSLLSSQLIKNMFDGIFNKKYVIYIPESLYSKQNKLDKIFKMFDDDFAKNSITVLVQFNEFADNKKELKLLIKEGYKFSIDLNNVTVVKKRNIENLYIADYIFIDKDKANKTNILDIIPEEVRENVLYDDITTKVGYWGE